MQLAVSTSQNHTMMRRRSNVWYSVKDGNWEDPNTWLSNALDKKANIYPQYGDDVHISHTVDYNNSLTGAGPFNGWIYNLTIGNLSIHTVGKLTSSRSGNQMRLIVTGGLYCDGTIDYSTSTSPIALYLGTHINYCNNFVAGSTSNVIYTSYLDHPIMPVTYYNLEISNTGTKSVIANLTVNNQLNIDTLGGTLELGTYDANFKHISVGGKLSKISGGTINITGLTTFSGTIAFTGNPTVNMSGTGISSSDTRNGINFGSTVNITTTQTWAFTSSSNILSSIGSGIFLIYSGVTLTIGSIGGTGSNIGGWLNMGTVNGVDSTSTLLIDGSYGFGNTNAIMATGVFNLNHSGNSRILINTGVIMNLPLTSFYDLDVAGTSTVIGNTTVSRNFSVEGSLQLSTYDFSVSGISTISGGLNKSGAGTVSLNTLTINGSSASISFTGNPIVNLAGNWTGDCRGGVNFGTNTVTITASMTIGIWTSGNVAYAMAHNFLIASGKTLTNTGLNTTSGGIQNTGTINGADSTAIFDNRSFYYNNNSAAPMNTGKLYCNQTLNTFIYGLGGNQDITSPSDATPGYQNLILQGSGVKRLLGNVSVKGTYTLTSPATLNTNGFALTNP